MFLRNAWYVGAWADELKSGELLARTICGDQIVFWRDAAGKVCAVEDRCCHRLYPLSKGSVKGDLIKCGYHGFEYDCTGKCVHIPSQQQIPASAKVRHYAMVERHSALFIWMGDAASADLATIPVLPTSDAQFGWRGTRYYVRGNYELIIENLLDLTHLTFIHASTIGNYALIDNPNVKVERWEREVQVSRWMINSDPPPTYVKAEKNGFKGRKVDRWQIIRWTSPTIVRLWTGAAPTEINPREKIAAHGAPAGSQLEGIGLFNLNMITPETETTTHYFWAQGQDMQPRNQAVTDLVFNQIETAFSQDWAVFELQQERMNQAPGRARIDVNGDAGGMQAISILRRAIEAETKLRVAA
jgi:phenylpropionate dioxygenase-like ring-hydroxylating dioxygenase large terminal subunit